MIVIIKKICSPRSIVKIDITENALLKIAGLIEAFDGEVGWHGTGATRS